jgi:hypothetical protein
MNLPMRRLITAAATCGLLVTAAVTSGAPAGAAVLFSDDFAYPTRNIWITGGGGAWSLATEDGSGVWRQSSTTAITTAYAGSGSTTGTEVTARVKPAAALSETSLLSVAGRVANPNNLYYAGLRGTTLEIGYRSWTTLTAIASAPFTASAGEWYTLSLSFPAAGVVAGSVTGPDGTTATVSGADPDVLRGGDKVGLHMVRAAASADYIGLTNAEPPPPPPTGPCPVTIAMNVSTDFSYGFIASLDITNVSSAPIVSPWTLSWRFGRDEYFGYLGGATWYQVGQRVTLTRGANYPPIAPGATLSGSVYFIATGSGPAPAQAPTGVTFNGISCPLTFSTPSPPTT